VNHDYAKPETKGAEILTEAHHLITGPRQEAYSHPFDDYHKVKELFRTITGIQMTVQHAVTFMICVKLARIGTNMQRGEWHHDSVVDAAGYLGCLSMVHEHVQNHINETVTRLHDDR
jgi:hypothetical protein